MPGMQTSHDNAEVRAAIHEIGTIMRAAQQEVEALNPR